MVKPISITTNEPDKLARLREKLHREMAVEAKEREAEKAEREAEKAEREYWASPEGQRKQAEENRNMILEIRKIMSTITAPTGIYDPFD